METPRKYDLEEKSKKFSLSIRNYCMQLKKNIINKVYVVQLIRSAGSVPANYIEANENLGQNDLRMHIRICRKEAKESRLWLEHTITDAAAAMEQSKAALIQEAFELELIFGKMLQKLT